MKTKVPTSPATKLDQEIHTLAAHSASQPRNPPRAPVMASSTFMDNFAATDLLSLVTLNYSIFHLVWQLPSP